MSFVALDKSNQKKLRDTKVGQWLRTSAPKILDAVGDALPDSGASDNSSDSWLAKHTRPIIVLSLVVALFVFIILDSLDIAFEVRDAWVTLYEILIVTAVGGYFTLRSVFDKRNNPM
jgi:hypothetical protein